MVRRIISRGTLAVVAALLVGSWAHAGYSVGANAAVLSAWGGVGRYSVNFGHHGTLLNNEDDITWYMYTQGVVTGPTPRSHSTSDSDTVDGNAFPNWGYILAQNPADAGDYSVLATTNMSAWGGSEGTVWDASSDTDSFEVF